MHNKKYFYLGFFEAKNQTKICREYFASLKKVIYTIRNHHHEHERYDNIVLMENKWVSIWIENVIQIFLVRDQS